MTFTCQSGFTVLGNSSITCNDGTWNGKVPVCKGKRGMSDPSLHIYIFFALADYEEPKLMEP